jgi:hypothetical protein
MGALIVARADGNRTGWLIVVSAALLALTFSGYTLGSALAVNVPSHPLASWLVLAAVILFAPAALLAIAIPIVFPDGSLPGPRWRPAMAIVIALAAVGDLAIVLRSGSLVGDRVANPVASWLPTFPDLLLDIFGGLGQISLAAMAALAALAVGTRFRASTGVLRQQLKWCLAAMIAPACLVSFSLIGTPGDLASNLARIHSSEGARLVDLLTVLMLPVMAATLTSAILRYRLYEIDRLVSRTISYGLVSAVLVALYGIAILLLQDPLRAVTGGDTLLLAASTLGVAILFQPLRQRIQQLVDRRFNRGHYDAARTSEAFAERVRSHVDLQTLVAELNATARGAVEPANVGIWLRERRHVPVSPWGSRLR